MKCAVFFLLKHVCVREVDLRGVTHIYQMLKEDSWSAFPGIREKTELSNYFQELAQAGFEIACNININRELCSL